ncbi:hypothetical protein KSS87_002476 [Heliosperma pusillum]|nr:hypothetical protein KSS87_001791 [Heliosperma pusillum]KAH9626829.1 hypothetical protein KSS87_002474 [Heliosperma pusillum]KAH9626831.1 hypothetical protein KSS87_002476 [Heliosperma pusillum]
MIHHCKSPSSDTTQLSYHQISYFNNAAFYQRCLVPVGPSSIIGT